MKIRHKMIACGVVSILTAALLGGVGFWGVTRLAAAMADNELSVSALRNHLEGDMMHDALRADVLAAFTTDPNDSAAVQQVRDDLAEHSAWFQRAMDANAKLPLPTTIRQAIDASQPALTAYIDQARSIVDKALREPRTAQADMPAFRSSFTALEDKNEALSSLIEAHTSNAREASQAAVSQAAAILMLGIGLTCALLGLITWRLMRSVLPPLEKSVAAAKAIAQGNLREHIDIDSDDESGQLQQALAEMQSNLRQMIDSIRQQSQHLQQTVDGLGATSQSILHAATEQSEGATSIAAAMEQMIQNIAQIAHHSRDAQSICAQSEELAGNGGQVILDVVEGMNHIAAAVNESSTSITALGQSSEQINSIIQVIKSIAEQTNLLALNAAIEAARAGEAGRGFAVVADEVRNLAARTAQSTQEITAMIELIRSSTSTAVASMQSGVTSVGQGVSLARQAGESISSIRNGTQRAAHVVQEISHNIDEQSKASHEVAQRVEQIAQMSQRNTQTVGELTTAAHALSEVAQAMQGSVQRFRT
ncbi:Methyl-accepting chemotaxis protein [Pseudomonas sp. 8Z]|uniref:methyl-accepting chemotaxis protein n=1 Tax=Pseudomonas sp. 8Z TaxID=2653166 RepID=UPI0012F34FDE|nr:methyl-accepting chemotaxis protein [Pseudomonas sp. 8Z]VXD00549.1 Methyl-accepting chemotaxis protein [Pseudomonas sp. 8Z]